MAAVHLSSYQHVLGIPWFEIPLCLRLTEQGSLCSWSLLSSDCCPSAGFAVPSLFSAVDQLAYVIQGLF